MKEGAIPDTPAITVRYCEDALRKAGVPKALARKIMSVGFTAATAKQDPPLLNHDAAFELAEQLLAAADILKGFPQQ